MYDDKEEIEILNHKIDLLEEELEIIHNYLSDMKIPTKDEKGNEISIIGRIEYLLNSLRD